MLIGHTRSWSALLCRLASIHWSIVDQLQGTPQDNPITKNVFPMKNEWIQSRETSFISYVWLICLTPSIFSNSHFAFKNIKTLEENKF